MRKFKERPFGDSEVDLDDDLTYSHLPKTETGLDDMMFKEIGYATVYMNYFPDRKKLFPVKKPKTPTKTTKTHLSLSGYAQRERVEKLIKYFAENRDKHYGDVKWLREQVFLFQDEIENMC